jgi:hypothetical protein
VIDPVPAAAKTPYRRDTMTQQEHELQRELVALSLRICPEGARHKGKGHEARQSDADDRTR